MQCSVPLLRRPMLLVSFLPLSRKKKKEEMIKEKKRVEGCWVGEPIIPEGGDTCDGERRNGTH